MRKTPWAASLGVAAMLAWFGCDNPFTTPGSADASAGSLCVDTSLARCHRPSDSTDTAVSVRPADSSHAGDSVATPVLDSTTTPVGLDSGFVAGGGIRAVPVFDKARVPLANPVWFGALPGRKEAYIALEQYTGTVVLITRTDTGWGRSEFFKVAVRADGEMGLLGIAFHPRFAENRKYYLHYVPQGGDLATVIEEREADATLLKDSGKPGRLVIRIVQPPHPNHKSALPIFGPKDGYLYVPVADGGNTNAAQDRSQLLGKILRLDVDVPDSFRVPADNPFVGRQGIRPEIWALGVRNPWRWSFDAATGEMWIGDVGEDVREEIDVAHAGDNLGWGWMEGNSCHQTDSCHAAFQPPLIDFTRDQLTVIIGGYVYRGDPASPWYGAYFFADHASHSLWSLRRGPDGKSADTKKLLTLPASPSSFGTDGAGNLYVAGYASGVIYRLEADSGSAPGRGRL